MSNNLKLLVIFGSLIVFSASVLFPYANIHFWLPAANWEKHNVTATPINPGVCYSPEHSYRGGRTTKCFTKVLVEVGGTQTEVSWTNSSKLTEPFQTIVWQDKETGEIRQSPESSVAAKAIRVVLMVSWVSGLLYGFWMIIQTGRKQASGPKKIN